MKRLLNLIIVPALVGCGQAGTPPAVAPTQTQTWTIPKPGEESDHVQLDAFNARVAELDFELGELSRPDDDNEVIRENLLRYCLAIDESADPILDEPDANIALRRRAAEVKFSAVIRLLPFEPAILPIFLKRLDRIDKRDKEDSVADIIAYYRVLAFCEDISPDALRELSQEAFDEFIQAVQLLAKVKKAHPDAGPIVLQGAAEAERRGLNPIALELYERYAEKFPNESAAVFALGYAERIRLLGQVVVLVEGPGLDGKPIALEDYRGKVVLMSFWLSTDGAARAEVPYLRQVIEAYAPKGLVVIGVTLDTDPKQVKDAIESLRIDWPQMTPAVGSNDPWGTPLGLRFGVSSVPFHLIFDRNGRLVAYGSTLAESIPEIETALDPPVVVDPPQPVVDEP